MVITLLKIKLLSVILNFVYLFNYGGFNMKATVDQERCFGCEFCASTCPEIFEIKELKPDIEKSFAKDCEIPNELIDLAFDIESNCPAAAIIIEN